MSSGDSQLMSMTWSHNLPLTSLQQSVIRSARQSPILSQTNTHCHTEKQVNSAANRMNESEWGTVRMRVNRHDFINVMDGAAARYASHQNNPASTSAVSVSSSGALGICLFLCFRFYAYWCIKSHN